MPAPAIVSRSVRRFHTLTSTAVPTVASTEHRERRNPRHIVEAAAHRRRQHRRPILARQTSSESTLSRPAARPICVCSSPIILSESGQPTWLHSSSTCPQPHAQIILCPTPVEPRRSVVRPQHHHRQHTDRQRLHRLASVPRPKHGAPRSSRPAPRHHDPLPRRRTSSRFGTSATNVPTTTIPTPIQIQLISGFRNTLMIGWSVSGFLPS